MAHVTSDSRSDNIPLCVCQYRTAQYAYAYACVREHVDTGERKFPRECDFCARNFISTLF